MPLEQVFSCEEGKKGGWEFAADERMIEKR
jgi:hypothetical protein